MRSKTKLQAARRRAGVTLEQLAEKTRLHYATVREADVGARPPLLSTRLRISAALGDTDFSLWPEDSRRELRHVKAMMQAMK